jgi:CubicO group peptidase (beta-lactamase class C family)
LPHGYETESVNTTKEAGNAVMALPLVEPPGNGFTYSNNNYQLAAAIIEIASGKPYSEALHDAFLEPLSLHNVGQAGIETSKTFLPATNVTPDRLMRPS